MTEYLLAALIAWTGQSPEALRPWAEAMAAVCTSRVECIELAAQAQVETRFMPWVLDGSCNNPAWRISRRGWERNACDGGLAYGPWQMHEERLRGATPELQASVALETMRRAPGLWTTRKAARSHAAWWLRTH